MGTGDTCHQSAQRGDIAVKYSAENVLLFYAALPTHDGWVLSRVHEILDREVDAEYLNAAAEAYGVASGLVALLTENGKQESISLSLLRAAEQEAAVTVSMHSLYEEIATLLERAGLPFIPLKGCDRRIVELARPYSNPMQDVDILVHPTDVVAVGKLLVGNGYLHLGSFSGAHMNFATDEEFPRFIEIHWDLVNRRSPVQRRLFSPSLGNIWKRSSILCGASHLSPEDLICYTIAHAAKEYFRRPKWIVDIACIIDSLMTKMDPVMLKEIVGEWGVSAVFGIVAEALDTVLPERRYDTLYDSGAKHPRILGQYIAHNLFGYSRLYSIRPLCALSFAPSFVTALSVAMGIGERLVKRR